MRRIIDRNRSFAAKAAAKSALFLRLQLVSLALRRRAQLIDGLLERTLAEQAKFDEEPLLPRSFVADSCGVFLKGGELRVRRSMRRIRLLCSLRTSHDLKKVKKNTAYPREWPRRRGPKWRRRRVSPRTAPSAHRAPRDLLCRVWKSA